MTWRVPLVLALMIFSCRSAASLQPMRIGVRSRRSGCDMARGQREESPTARLPKLPAMGEVFTPPLHPWDI